ncbi:GLOBIN domain-containing protein [Aphelenchoides bicaudatus]|nr:GLOBIN domain-containing protein [Aphelenchoides bicaudatus]
MGNAESNSQQHQGHHSRKQTPTTDHERKRRSLSPSQLQMSSSDKTITTSALSNAQNSSSSFHSTTDTQQAVRRRINQRRAKSFRVPNRGVHGGSFRVTVCPVTGLSDNQKQLIQQKWLELDKAGILEFGFKVFQIVFNRDKKFLKVIGLFHLADRKPNSWKGQVNFRVHTQRFCECLDSLIRNLDEPEKCVGLLHEFGSSHLSTYEKDNACEKMQKLPGSYWDSIIYAINNCAKDLQVESSRGSESPRNNTYDKRFLLPGDDLSLNTSSACPSPTQFSSCSLGPATPRRSVCPRECESWCIFASYVVNQMRFGFEMERLLQAELRRLLAGSVQLSWQLPSSDENTTTFSSRDDGTLDGLSIQTNTTALHGGGSISSTSNSSNSSSGSSANVYTTELPSTDLIQHNSLPRVALVE